MNTPAAKDLEHMRHAIRLSDDAQRRGNPPFGAVLVAPDGAILATGENSIVTTNDLTAHAEMNALRAACGRFSAQQIAAATMYASGEPCPMCSGAMMRLGMRRVLFAMPTGKASPYMPKTAGAMPGTVNCRDVLALAPQKIEVLGPMLEDEAKVAFEAFARRSAG